MDVQKIKAALQKHAVKPGTRWYGITNADPDKPKARLAEHRPDGQVGVLGALVLEGGNTFVELKGNNATHNLALGFMDNYKTFGFETPEQVSAFACGFDGMKTTRKHDPEAFEAGAKLAAELR